MVLQIRKRVSLDFLGEEYKDSYLIFKAIPIKDYEELQTKIESIDEKKSISFIQETLKKYFINGKAANESGELEDVTAEDLGELDQEAVINCFETLTGQNINKENDFLDEDSKSPSSTTPEPPQ